MLSTVHIFVTEYILPLEAKAVLFCPKWSLLVEVVTGQVRYPKRQGLMVYSVRLAYSLCNAVKKPLTACHRWNYAKTYSLDCAVF